MTAKQYLKQAYRLNELIDSDIKELEQLKALATSISAPNLSGMPGSAAKKQEAPFANTIQKIIDLEKIINTEIDRFIDLKKEIREKITMLEEANERLILKNRYLLFMTWEQIAEDMNFTVQWVHELHKKALKSFANKNNT